MAKAKGGGRPRKNKGAPQGPVGLEPAETKCAPEKAVSDLCREIEGDGGAVLSAYREPLGGRWLILATLPLEQLEPTPYQRGLSESHVKRLADVISRTSRYLDPVIAVRVGPRRYQTPNGHHRASALKLLGARSITALVMTEPEVARLILALNVEKAHNLREKCQEVIRLARDLSSLPGAREAEFSLEFEEPAFLTLGITYEERGRFAGGAYHPILKRVDGFMDKPLTKALEERGRYSKALVEIDDRVSEVVAALKERGLQSPYLRNFVVARINPIRFRPTVDLSVEETLEKMSQAAKKFNADKITVADISRSGGPPGGGGEAEAD